MMVVGIAPGPKGLALHFVCRVRFGQFRKRRAAPAVSVGL